MPTYSYRCLDCQHEFDIQQGISEDPKTICPECEGNLQKVFGKVGITFRGTGFYTTDSAAKPSEPSSD